MLVTLEQTMNNFGKTTDRLKTFLKWADLQYDAPVNRRYQLYTPLKFMRV